MSRPPRAPLAALVTWVAVALLAATPAGAGAAGTGPAVGAGSVATPGVSVSSVDVAQAGAVPGAVPASGPQDRAKADELRRVARDALSGPDADDDVDLDGSLLGIGGVVWRVLLVVLVAVAVVVGVALYRRGPRRRRRSDPTTVRDGDGADDLERLALRAEQDGEHRAAVVLWFRAGTRRLAARLRTAPDVTATAGQVARASGDPRVRDLAVAHDRAAYGPGPVGPEASAGAREGWRTVLREPVVGERHDAAATSDEGPR